MRSSVSVDKTLTRSGLDIAKIREDFPNLGRSMRGKSFVYLDNGATSLKPRQVIESEVRYYEEYCANIHRGVYEFSEIATEEYDSIRAKVAQFIGAPADGHVIFTRGTTESVNVVMNGWGRKNIGAGDVILISEIEHHANYVTWQQLAQEKGARLEFIPALPDGSFDLNNLDALFDMPVKFVAVTAMSNVTGYKPDIKTIIDTAHRHGVPVLVDAAQYASHHTVNVAELDCDFLCFSGHKMCGPTGIGVLYGRESLLEDMDPFMYGGDMVVRVKRDTSSFKPLPERFEAGTPNIAGVMGLGAAVDYLQGIGMEAIAEHEQRLIEYTLIRAAEFPDLVSYGPADHSSRGGIFSFNLGDVHSHDVGSILDQEGIAVRTGFHCAQPIMRLFGIPGTVRASMYLYNDTDDIDMLFTGLDKVRGIFNR